MSAKASQFMPKASSRFPHEELLRQAVEKGLQHDPIEPFDEADMVGAAVLDSLYPERPLAKTSVKKFFTSLTSDNK